MPTIEIILNPNPIVVDVVQLQDQVIDIVYGQVYSVNGKTGNVVLTQTDITRTQTITTASTITLNADLYDHIVVTALDQDCRFEAPIGTPLDGQRLRIRVTASEAVNIDFVDVFRFKEGDNIPDLEISQTAYFDFVYNSMAGVWDCLLLQSYYSPLDVDALIYLNTLPVDCTEEYRVIVNTTVRALKTADCFFKIDRLPLFCSQYRENAVYSLVNPSTTPCEEVGGVTWTAFSGYRGGDATKRIDSHFNPTVDAVNFTQDSATLFFWSKDNISDPGVDGGIQIGTSGSGTFVFSNDTNTLYAAINSGGGVGIVTSVSGAGLTAIVRKTSTLVQVWKNGIKIFEGTLASTALQNFNFWWLCLNRENSQQFSSSREIAFAGMASGDLDQLAFYNAMAAYMTAIALLPIPPVPPDPGISDVIAKIHFPSLLDVSGNGYDSVLGASLPVGISAPSQINDDTIFSGLQSIKLNANLQLTKLNINTVFLNIFCSSPEETQCLVNFSTAYANGLRLFVEDIGGPLRRSMVGAVYLDEGPTTEPIYGKSLPKLQLGYNTIGLSFSATAVTIFINGIVSKIVSNNPYPASEKSGWIGAWPGSADDNYTLPANFTIESGEHLWIYNYAATVQQMQVKGNAMMREKGVSLVVFEGDSITLGYGVSTNANNWPSVVTQYLLDNTYKKWSSLNIGVGGRALQTMSAACNQNNYAISGNGVASCNINVIAPAQGEGALNIYNLLAGVNDLIGGATLSDLQTSFTTLLNFRKSQGFDCYVYSVTPATELNGTQESIRLAYNSWLASHAASMGFTFVNICSNPHFDSQADAANTTYFYDGIHLTDLSCTSIVGPMAGAAIVANIT